MTKQQEQTKIFFNKDYLNWFNKGQVDSKLSVNVIDQRNQYVINIIKKFLKKGDKTLDVGCGTGDLVINLLKKKIDAYGIDFATNMVKQAKKQAKKNKFSTDTFYLSSFFDFKNSNKYKLISANGFIEYISEKELDLFFKKSYDMLEKSGIIVFGSRNRLFNVFSFNNYTNAEIKDHTITELINECIIFNSINIFNDLKKKKHISKISRNIKNHAYTGIEVNTRYQYTPFQLIQKLKTYGFEAFDLIPINIHIMTTGAKSVLPKINDITSNYLQTKNDVFMKTIPLSSSFMIAAKKK